MSSEITKLTDSLYEYLQSVSLREPEILQRLRAETAKLPMGRMQITPMEGQFLALLVRLMNARRTLEIGVFMGYSSLAVARALPEDGRIVACDMSEEWTAIARRYWEEAGVAHKIDLRLGFALDTLDALLAEGQKESFDFAFIDADKENYELYFERCYSLLRPGGLMAVDNVFWKGSVIDKANQEDSTRAIRDFNEMLHYDERIELSMLPVGDGLTLALKL